MKTNQISEDAFSNRIARMKDYLKSALENVDNLHVFISGGNRKTGIIPSVSLLPVIDCGNCKICSHSCYDLRHDMIYKEGINTRATNSAIFRKDPDRYFREIEAWLTLNNPHAFRWHIGGDIKNATYFRGMIKVAKNFPDIRFLAFTKMFNLVNAELTEGNYLPGNLQILFSGWPGQRMINVYGLPSSHPLYPDGTTSAHEGAKLCTGNCTECLAEKRLCWYLKTNEEVVFPLH